MLINKAVKNGTQTEVGSCFQHTAHCGLREKWAPLHLLACTYICLDRTTCATQVWSGMDCVNSGKAQRWLRGLLATGVQAGYRSPTTHWGATNHRLYERSTNYLYTRFGNQGAKRHTSQECTCLYYWAVLWSRWGCWWCFVALWDCEGGEVRRLCCPWRETQVCGALQLDTEEAGEAELCREDDLWLATEPGGGGLSVQSRVVIGHRVCARDRGPLLGMWLSVGVRGGHIL